MITNGSDRSLSASPGTLPDVSDAMFDYFRNLTFVFVEKSVVNYSSVEKKSEIPFRGVVQPFTATQLFMKPEGQRKWRWQMVHAMPDLVLDIDDIVEFEDVPYRVMQENDYRAYGYVEYHLAEDYREGSAT